MKSMSRAFVALVGGALVTSMSAEAAAAESAHPHFTGFWNLSRKQRPVDAELVAKLPKDTALLDDSGAAEFPPGEFGGLKLKPAAIAAAKSWKPQDDMTPSRACLP